MPRAISTGAASGFTHTRGASEAGGKQGEGRVQGPTIAVSRVQPSGLRASVMPPARRAPPVPTVSPLPPLTAGGVGVGVMVVVPGPGETNGSQSLGRSQPGPPPRGRYGPGHTSQEMWERRWPQLAACALCLSSSSLSCVFSFSFSSSPSCFSCGSHNYKEDTRCASDPSLASQESEHKQAPSRR